MLEKLKLVEARYLEMAERAAQPDFYNDPKAASQLLKEQRQLEPIITAYRSYMKTTQEQDDLRAMLSEGLDPEMKALCQEEFSANKKKLEELEQELKILLLPRDPNDDKNVIVEIRGGVGGARFSVSCEISACDINFFTFRIFTAHIQMIYQKRFIFKFFKFVYHILPSKNCTP